MNRQTILFGIVIFILNSGVLYSQDVGDIYKYSKNADQSPIQLKNFSCGVGDADKKGYYIGSDDDYKAAKILSGSSRQSTIFFDCILRFYGQRVANSGAESISWDLPIRQFPTTCNSKISCPIRFGTQTYSPGNSICGGKKHYVRWGGIHDGSNSLSKTLIPIDKKNPIWKEIEFKLVMSPPEGTEINLIPSDSSWTPFSDDIVKLFDNVVFMAYPETIDIFALIELYNCEFSFPISFQNCDPGVDDNHMLFSDSTDPNEKNNCYNVKFKIRFPYAEWANAIDLANHTNGLNIEDKANRWELTLEERKFFIWDKVSPKIDFTHPGNNCEMKATTGDPMYNNNIIRFKVIDDNPNQELDTVTVTLSNGSFSKIYQYIEGDPNNTMKKPTITRKIDLNADDNFIAEFEVEFKAPPTGMKRDEILKSDQYFIAPYDSIEPIKGEITASVMYGVNDPETDYDGRVPSPDEPKAEFTINVTDNDPPGLEVGFILMKSPRTEIKSFVGDFSAFPASKKACGIKAGTEILQAEYCLDLDVFGTPVDFNIYPFGRGTPVINHSVTSYSLG
ncbi:hypothetical protein KAJ27_03440, partial [bacterium]|nr:hypothetical protein [bacterium]